MRSALIDLRGEAQPPPRDPYVQNVSASSAVIAWVSEEPDVGLSLETIEPDGTVVDCLNLDPQ